MAILKYAKVLVLAPAIGSALIGIAGLVFGVLLIAGHAHSGNRVQGQKSAPAGIEPQGATTSEVSQAVPPSRPVQKSPVKAPATLTAVPLDFTKLVGKNQTAFLSDYAGRAVDDTQGKQKVKALVGMVAPYAPYHYGADFPLPQVLNSLLLSDPQPVEIRNGRYAMMTGFRNAVHNRRAFLWIDLRKGIALGGIFFDPSNGEPSPTLTIFSEQLDRHSVRMSQLPSAFAEDLRRWAATAGLPLITTRYFIGTSGEKTVLAHDEDFCARTGNESGSHAKGVCKQMNAQAALIDLTAARFMARAHNASNATMKTISATGPAE